MKLKDAKHNPFPGKTIPRVGKIVVNSSRFDEVLGGSNKPRGGKVSPEEFRARQSFREECGIYNELYILATVFQAMEELPYQIQNSEDVMALLNNEPSDKVRNSDFYKALQEELQGYVLSQDLTAPLKQKIAGIQNKEEAFLMLTEAMAKYGIAIENKEVTALNYEDMRSARTAFNGFLQNPSDAQLSEAYDEFRKNRDYLAGFRAEDYNLKQSSAWNKMKGQKAYAGFDIELKQAFVSEKIPPEVVNKLSIADFERIVYNYRGSTTTDNKKVNVFRGARKAFVEVMGENHKAEIDYILTRMDVEENVSAEVIAAMEKGRIPPLIPTRNGTYIVATVHHNNPLQDGGSNDLENLKLMFDRAENKEVAEKLSYQKNSPSYQVNTDSIYAGKRFPQWHKLMHKLDTFMARQYRSKKKYEERQANPELLKALIKAKVEKQAQEDAKPKMRQVRRTKLPERIACVGGLSAGMNFNFTPKDVVDFNEKLAKNEEIHKSKIKAKSNVNYHGRNFEERRRV